MGFHGEALSAPHPTPQAGGPPLVGCPRLLIQYIRSYPPYPRPFLHPQPEGTPCRGDRDPLITVTFFFLNEMATRSLYATGMKTQSLIVCTLIWASVMNTKPQNLMFVYVWNFCAWCGSLASFCLSTFCILCMLATGAGVFITVLSILTQCDLHCLIHSKKKCTK